MRLVFRWINQILIALAWGMLILLGIFTMVVVVTVMNIAFAISNGAGLGFLGFVLMVVWMLFYAVKD